MRVRAPDLLTLCVIVGRWTTKSVFHLNRLERRRLLRQKDDAPMFWSKRKKLELSYFP